MSFSDPSFNVVLDEANGSMNAFVSSLFQIPFYLRKLALVGEFGGNGLWLDSVVEVWAFFRGSELEQKFTYLIVDLVSFKDLEVGDFVCGLLYEGFTEIVEGLKAVFLKAFIDFLEQLCKLKVINGGIELESNKIISIKSVHALKRLFLMNKGWKNEFKIGLNCLKEIINIDICKLILPYFYIVDLLCGIVEVSPKSKSSLGIAENYV